MKVLSNLSNALIGALALTGAAHSQVPGTNDTSDAQHNTGSGTGTLAAITTSEGKSVAGFSAPGNNTIGIENTAF